jgi:transcriptional regulator with XRE-family HTH domain
MEKGERRPTNAELLKLAQELSTSLNELLREHTVVADASPRFRMAPRHARSDAVEEAVERLKALGRRYVELEQVLSITRALVQRNFRPLAAQKQMGLKPVRENAERWLPQRYERLALEAFAQELLSEGELANYLHCER